MSDPYLRQALPRDAQIVSEITTRAYTPVYMASTGRNAGRVTEDPVPWISAGGVWIAEENNAPVGLLIWGQASDYAFVHSLAVIPEAQHRGIGQALLNKAEALTREAGLRVLRLVSNGAIERNSTIYSAFGFDVEREADHHLSEYAGETLVYFVKLV